MSIAIEPSQDDALLGTRHDHASVTDRIVDIPLRRGFHRRWLALMGISLSLVMMGLVSVLWLLYRGVGVWGINIPVAWGFAIVNFVWWIGIGHAGTLISAILLLLRQNWRNSINRFAEAMTLFAVANAGLFPLLHLGRIWRFYYLLPYPNTMGLWPQWQSPLVWDVFAVLTYSLVSALFWYLGLIPDFATMRDRARRPWIRKLTGLLALGWRGSLRHWHHYQKLYLLLAGLATPLVVSVHSIVSLDFAVSIVPGWHTTVFPPFFVAGAIFSGFAMVLTLAIPLRRAFRLHDLITDRHFDLMAKVMLTAGLVVAYGYIMETFTGWFSGEAGELRLIQDRVTGAYGWAYWLMIACNLGIAQLLWFRAVRRSPITLFLVACAIHVGMWLERFVIVVGSLHVGQLPSSTRMFFPTVWDWTLFLGTIGLFATFMLLFVRFLPMVSMFEMRELIGSSPSRDSHETKTLLAEQKPLSGTLPDESLHGVVGEFNRESDLRAAARSARSAGYERIEVYSPIPLEGLDKEIDVRRSPVPMFVLGGALAGLLGAYAMQWYSAAVDYPIQVGGRPAHSWPAFLPLTFELAVLGGAICGVVGLFWAARLPRLHHPILDVAGFERASRDRFFLCIERDESNFDRAEVRRLLQNAQSIRVSEVPT